MPLSDSDDSLFNDLLNQDMNIPYGRFTYPCRLKLTPNAGYLSVQLHGAVPDRENAVLPVFSRWNWGNILGAHVLAICDPTIYLNETLGLGWYLGDKDESVMPGVVTIAQTCAELIGMDKEQIIFSGSSGGGFAASHAAALIPNGKAVVINPQTDLSQYSNNHLQPYIAASGCSSMEEAMNVFGNRWKVIETLLEAHQEGKTPRIAFVQNKNDSGHYNNHYTPFANTFGLSLEAKQSINGNIMSILYDGPEDHVAESTDVVKRIIKEAVPFLLGIEMDNTPPELELVTQIKLDKGNIIASVQANNRESSDYQFACYLLKDRKVIEKKPYQNDMLFTFEINEAGRYMCQGYARVSNGERSASFSKVIDVIPQSLGICSGNIQQNVKNALS